MGLWISKFFTLNRDIRMVMGMIIDSKFAFELFYNLLFGSGSISILGLGLKFNSYYEFCTYSNPYS